MKELSITVKSDNRPDATYRFTEMPVRIGRSEQSQLCIRHEVIPRDLAEAWVEDNGLTVRLEEKPGLTNPLLSGNNIVEGGISGRRIEVSVGPVRLVLEPAAISKPGGPKKEARVRWVWGAFIGGSLVLLSALWISNNSASEKGSFPDGIPTSPFCKNGTSSCDTEVTCRERARLFLTRARELLSRPNPSPASRVRAASMLGQATDLYLMYANPMGETVRAEATLEMETVRVAFQKERNALIRAAENPKMGKQELSRAKAKVAAYLDNCDGPWKRWLLETTTPTENEGNK